MNRPYWLVLKFLSNCACEVWKAPVLDEETLEKYAPKEEKVVQSYDIEHYNMDMFTKMLYMKLHETIMQVEPKAKEEFKKLYIAHKLKTNFVDVVAPKVRITYYLLILILMRFMTQKESVVMCQI